MEISYSCPSCGGANRLSGGSPASRPACARCGEELPLALPGAPDIGPLTACRICGDDKLFIQKKFSQKIGCLIVGIGAVLVPWTYGLSLAVCAFIDFLLYRRLPLITVCYICGARYSGVPISPDHAPYDLMTAQTYEARSVNWRNRHDRSATT